MSIRKRNEFLDGDDSDDNFENDIDVEADEVKGAVTARRGKRRKVHLQSEDESLDDEANDESVKVNGASTNDAEGDDLEPLATALNRNAFKDENDVDKRDAVSKSNPSSAKSKAQALKQINAAQKAAHRSGVVYISRVPPFMKSQTLKHFLAPHAPKGLGRIFLTPEDHAAHLRRVKSGGNRKKSFTDGWVEFVSKRDAKIAAEMLNGNIIGGKKGNFYHDDLWNIKYLKGFKWSHLTEQIAAENAERAARLREEVRRTREENKAFLQDVERGKMLEGMESKRKGRKKAEPAVEQLVRPSREFKQKKAQAEKTLTAEGKQSDELQRVLGKIF